MKISMKIFFITSIGLLFLFGCSSRHDDGVIKKETVLNNTTGEGDMQHTEGYITTDAIGLLEKLDVETAHVVGHSMGGMIAQLVAIRRPDLVITLTLLATAPSHTFDETYYIHYGEQIEYLINRPNFLI